MQATAPRMTEKAPSTKRTTIVLPALVYEYLERKAYEEGRATANLAAFAVEQFIRSSYPEVFPNPFEAKEGRK